MSDFEFKKVSYKRKKIKLQSNEIIQKYESPTTDSHIKLETVLRRISEAKIEISTTDLYASVVASIKEGLNNLDKPKISKIICLGLGKIGECLTARYQFAVTLCLSDLFNVEIFVYDPVFSERDKDILKQFGVNILNDNLEGKYGVDQKTTLFYLPHCPKQLSNNLLWANWGLSLKYCIIIANSFNKIIETNSIKNLEKSANYITKISPYALELPIINSFKYYEIFNDSAVHVFPQLNFVCTDLWIDNLEPSYKEDDLEFITNEEKNIN